MDRCGSLPDGLAQLDNLQAAGEVGNPLTKRFAFYEYLDLLSRSNHNFIRLWAWESAGYWHHGKGAGKECYEPLPYGPGRGKEGGKSRISAPLCRIQPAPGLRSVRNPPRYLFTERSMTSLAFARTTPRGKAP